MKAKIEAIRCETEEIKNKFRNLYAAQKSNHIKATITLLSTKANAQVYEYENGDLRHVYGSRALANRWAGREI